MKAYRCNDCNCPAELVSGKTLPGEPPWWGTACCGSQNVTETKPCTECYSPIDGTDSMCPSCRMKISSFMDHARWCTIYQIGENPEHQLIVTDMESVDGGGPLNKSLFGWVEHVGQYLNCKTMEEWIEVARITIKEQHWRAEEEAKADEDTVQ